MSEVESLINIPVEHCSNIFGQFDEYAKVIEKTLKVTIIVRDSSVKVIGAEAAVQRALMPIWKKVLSRLHLLHI